MQLGAHFDLGVTNKRPKLPVLAKKHDILDQDSERQAPQKYIQCRSDIASPQHKIHAKRTQLSHVRRRASIP
jgi:hypothetical protein